MGVQERKEREKEARREEIVNAAQAIFFEKGLANATVDDIAQAAELSKGTVYLYFHSKEDLYLAVANRGMDIMYAMFTEAVSTGENCLQLISNLGEAYYAFFDQYRDYFRTFYFFESPQFFNHVSEHMREQCVERDKKTWDLVTRLITCAVDEGLFHPELNPTEVGIMLWSNSNGFLKLLDRNGDHWKQTMGIDLVQTMRKSNALLIEAMMTEKAQKLYPGVMQYHMSDGTKEKTQ